MGQFNPSLPNLDHHKHSSHRNPKHSHLKSIHLKLRPPKPRPLKPRPPKLNLRRLKPFRIDHKILKEEWAATQQSLEDSLKQECRGRIATRIDAWLESLIILHEKLIA